MKIATLMHSKKIRKNLNRKDKCGRDRPWIIKALPQLFSRTFYHMVETTLITWRSVWKTGIFMKTFSQLDFFFYSSSVLYATPFFFVFGTQRGLINGKAGRKTAELLCRCCHETWVWCDWSDHEWEKTFSSSLFFFLFHTHLITWIKVDVQWLLLLFLSCPTL